MLNFYIILVDVVIFKETVKFGKINIYKTITKEGGKNEKNY